MRSTLDTRLTVPTEERLVLTSELLLDRYGIVTRGSVQAEGIDGGFAGVYKVFSASEDAGRKRSYYRNAVNSPYNSTATICIRTVMYYNVSSTPSIRRIVPW